MSDQSLNEARLKVAELRAHLEAAQAMLQLTDKFKEPRSAQAAAKAVSALQEAIDSAEVLA